MELPMEEVAFFIFDLVLIVVAFFHRDLGLSKQEVMVMVQVISMKSLWYRVTSLVP